jgi:hypothetical protein
MKKKTKEKMNILIGWICIISGILIMYFSDQNRRISEGGLKYYLFVKGFGIGIILIVIGACFLWVSVRH